LDRRMLCPGDGRKRDSPRPGPRRHSALRQNGSPAVSTGTHSMKRTVPVLIAATVGFVLILSYFVPFAASWGDLSTIWFDILAAFAFVLGGGNLLKMHLQRISDRRAGWGFSAVTIVTFLAVLTVGLLKVGVHPEEQSPDRPWSGDYLQ